MLPKNCKALVDALADNRWSFVVNHGQDTGGSPFVSVEAKRHGAHLIVTWHTRGSGSYRLFSCMLDKRDVTLTKAMEAATADLAAAA